jgi:hypothetical protein
MKTLRLAPVAAALLAFGAATPALAQHTVQTKVGGGGSPHVVSTWEIHGANIAITYGRPYLKGRADSVVMPIGKVWRTGADEATVLATDKPLTFGKIALLAGKYTINTVPGEDGWQLVFGKLGKEGQWGIPYQPQLEIGRTPMTLSHVTPPVDQLTITIDPTPTGGVLHVTWGTNSASAAFNVAPK